MVYSRTEETKVTIYT